MATKLSETGVVFPNLTTQTTAGVTVATGGTGISVSAANGAVTFTNSGVTSLVAGSGISVSGATGAVTVTASGGGTVTSVATGNGLSGGTITSSGTLIIGCPSWLSIGSYATLWHMSTGTVGAGDTASGSNLKYNISDGNASNAGDFGQSYTSNSGGTATSGTWRHMGSGKTGDPEPRYYVGLWCRVS
jgi:hypothetical protein